MPQDAGSREFILESGAELRITPAPFRDADALFRIGLKELRGHGIEDIDLKRLAGFKSVADIGRNKEVLGMVVNGLLSVVSSDAVSAALFKCAERATYQNVRVAHALFDDPTVGMKAREDYLEICAKLVEVNVGPFFARLFSGSKAAAPEKSEGSQTSR